MLQKTPAHMQFTDTKTGSFSGSCSTFLSERVNSHTTSRASFVAVAKPAWSSTLTSVHLCMMRPSTSSSFLLWRRRCASFSHSFFFFFMNWMNDRSNWTHQITDSLPGCCSDHKAPHSQTSEFCHSGLLWEGFYAQQLHWEKKELSDWLGEQSGGCSG